MKDKRKRKSLTLIVLLSVLLLPLIMAGQQPTNFFVQHDVTNDQFCATPTSNDCVRGAKILRKIGTTIDFANPVLTVPSSTFQQLGATSTWEAVVLIPANISGQRYGTMEFVSAIQGVDPNGVEVLSIPGVDIAQLDKKPRPPVGFGVR